MTSTRIRPTTTTQTPWRHPTRAANPTPGCFLLFEACDPRTITHHRWVHALTPAHEPKKHAVTHHIHAQLHTHTLKVHHLLPSKTVAVVFSSSDELTLAVRNGSVEAGLMSGLPTSLDGIVIFSSSLVSPRGMFTCKVRRDP